MKWIVYAVLSVAVYVTAAPTGPPPDPDPLPSNFYVSPSGSHVYPFADWATAATNIQAAVDAAVDGDLVLVGDGIYDTGTRITPGYACMNRLVIVKDITVQSVNGPESTFIVGEGPLGSNAVRGVHLRAGTLSGFTVTNGHTMVFDYFDLNASGGGVSIYGTRGVVSNCVLTGNAAANIGGASLGGRLYNCILTNNSASFFGGGSALSELYNCTLTDNSADSGGGNFGGILYNCALTHNSVTRQGGGTCYGTLNNCLLSDNTAVDMGGANAWATLTNCFLIGNSAESGGASAVSLLHNCILTDNSAKLYGGGSYLDTLYNCSLTGNTTDSGGGLYKGTAINCIISENVAMSRGGGIESGKAINCTITGNIAGSSEFAFGWGGGLRESIAINCIIVSNTAGHGKNLYDSSASFSCSPDLIHGVDGNITNAPSFLDPESGDYRLLATSPCIDAGDNSYATNSTDHAGNARIIDGDFDGTAKVDMGAYEFAVQEISVDILAPTINLKSRGRTPVAVLTSGDFDASTIDPQSVRFAGAEPVHWALEDIDGDGDIDLMLHFMTADLEINSSTTEVMLMGQTYDGVLVVGKDAVKVLGAK